MLRFLIGLGVVAFLTMSPPFQASEPTYVPVYTLLRQKPLYKRDGIASWYGEDFQGSETASGETFNMNALTAAHRYLPLGTRIRVTNLRNRRSLILRINDRGPFIPGRLLDVSRAAARLLGFGASGKARVRVQVVQARSQCGFPLVCPGARSHAMR
jgi:rare lipoprotein A (peptidoglycan hydrolase)